MRKAIPGFRAEQSQICRAAVCPSDSIPNKRMRQAVQQVFGAGPVCLTNVSKRFYRLFGEASQEHPVHLVAYGEFHAHVLVLLLQVEAHQLRVVMSLRRPLAQQLVQNARRRGSLPLVLFEEDGHRHVCLDCDVLPGSSMPMTLQGLPQVALPVDCQSEVIFVALSCLRLGEQTSVIEGQTLRKVDVSLANEESLLASPTD
jgi:hypothetical protein